MAAKKSQQITCCCFDLETSSLNADFGVILCGVVKAGGAKPKTFRADELSDSWAQQRSDDSVVLKAIVEELDKYDIWVAHNGLRFDLPFLRTRMAKWQLPPLPTRKLVDPVQLARNHFRMSYNSLNALANHLGCNTKTPLVPEVWAKATLDGDTDAMNHIVKHCVEDVKTLECVLDSLKVYSTSFNPWGSGR